MRKDLFLNNFARLIDRNMVYFYHHRTGFYFWSIGFMTDKGRILNETRETFFSLIIMLGLIAGGFIMLDKKEAAGNQKTDRQPGQQPI